MVIVACLSMGIIVFIYCGEYTICLTLSDIITPKREQGLRARIDLKHDWGKGFVVYANNGWLTLVPA